MPEDRKRFQPQDIDPTLKKLLGEVQEEIARKGEQRKGGLSKVIKKSGTSQGVILAGKIVHFDSNRGVYRVFVNHVGEIPAVDAGQAGHPFGAREYRTIPPGTAVLVFVSHEVFYGIIIAQAPDPDSAFVYAPNVITHGGGGHSPGSDPILKRLPQEYGETWIQGRPSDRLADGEFGITTFTGMGMMVDPFLATMKLDEETGLFIFYFDRHTRLSGKSLELLSHTYRELFQQREGFSVVEKGVALHAGEAIGILIEPKATTGLAPASAEGGFSYDYVIQQFQEGYEPKETSTDEISLSKPWLYMWEPPSGWDYIPYHRYRRWEGAIAKGGFIEFVAAPSGVTAWDDVPTHLYREYLLNDDRGKKFRDEALYSQSVAIDGFWHVSTKSGFHLGKDSGLPAPLRIRAEYDPDFQDELSKMPFSPTGTADIGFFDTEQITVDEFINAVLEGRYEFLRDKDEKVWRTLDPAEALDILKVVEDMPVEFYSRRIVRPAGKQYVRKKFYIESNGSRAYIDVLPDGTVVITDGSGSEIRMEGGNILISAPQDIYFTAGKNIFFAAGENFDVLSQGSIQMVSSLEHVKLRAAGILHLLGEGKCMRCDGYSSPDPSCTGTADCLCASGCDQFPCAGGVKIESPTTVVVDSRDISLLGRSYIYAHCIDARTVVALDLWAREGHYCHLTAATQCTDVMNVSAYMSVCSLHVTGSATKSSGSPLWAIGGLFKSWGESPLDCSANAGAIARKLLAKKLAAAPCNFLVDAPRFNYVIPEPRWHYFSEIIEVSGSNLDPSFDCGAPIHGCDQTQRYCPVLPRFAFPTLDPSDPTACNYLGTGEMKFEYRRAKVPLLLVPSGSNDKFAEDFDDLVHAVASGASGVDITLGKPLDAREVEKVHPRTTVHLICSIDPNCR